MEEQDTANKMIEPETIKKVVEQSTKKKSTNKVSNGKVLVEYLSTSQNPGLTKELPLSLARALEKSGKVNIIKND